MSASGTLCIAAHSHTSHKQNELQFEKGDVVTLIDEPSGDYCQATAADGSVGLVPMSSILERPGVVLQPMPWFHGPITRFEAEKILDRNQDGQFLMRTSQSTEGIYALAVSHKGAVSHYLIAMDFSTRKLTISGKLYFPTLLELVNYYMRNDEDLGTCLRVPRIRPRCPGISTSTLRLLTPSGVLVNLISLLERQ
ncbi:Tyrosine-protein kinase CSK [Geodia barretti]|uniref:Tyrosine-protein kinase CSK n=1 Tax=Geodia barretti TaxID=519541 RepID=A0AA35X097_GEOBA|nr:Tyrosine-protein kinase CSK [Geodia barretti]